VTSCHISLHCHTKQQTVLVTHSRSNLHRFFVRRKKATQRGPKQNIRNSVMKEIGHSSIPGGGRDAVSSVTSADLFCSQVTLLSN
jgi:hypothetical protein